MHWTEIPNDILEAFRDGIAIPAQPLALDSTRTFDVTRQRALTRYYLDAGAGGLAVGVHTTQFAIREVGLYPGVLELASETVCNWTKAPILLVAGVAGPTAQALEEARTARTLGYHAVLLSLAALKSASEDEIIAHCQCIAREMPLIGFYLQPSVGGFTLSANFWERFVAIENVIGIKVAPFNRYATLAVMRGVVAAGASHRVSFYTGNDDHIILDLLLPFRIGSKTLRFSGGLLGHWSVWTSSAIRLLERCKAARRGEALSNDLLAIDSMVTDCNSAFFDAANNYHGVIAGCHEVLRRQGLLEGIWCLDPNEGLGPGQFEEIDRVYALYPELNDDAFVAQNLHRWLSS